MDQNQSNESLAKEENYTYRTWYNRFFPKSEEPEEQKEQKEPKNEEQGEDQWTRLDRRLKQLESTLERIQTKHSRETDQRLFSLELTLAQELSQGHQEGQPCTSLGYASYPSCYQGYPAKKKHLIQPEDIFTPTTQPVNLD